MQPKTVSVNGFKRNTGMLSGVFEIFFGGCKPVTQLNTNVTWEICANLGPTTKSFYADRVLKLVFLPFLHLKTFSRST